MADVHSFFYRMLFLGEGTFLHISFCFRFEPKFVGFAKNLLYFNARFFELIQFYAGNNKKLHLNSKLTLVGGSYLIICLIQRV